MGKKKNLQKKHKFKHAEGQVGQAVGVAERPSQASAPTTAPAAGRSSAPTAVVGRDFSYVGKDLRRIAVMAVSLVALEFVLYYLLVHTSVGTTVYSFVNV